MELNIKKIEAYLESVKISPPQFCVQIGLSYSAWNTIKRTKRTSIPSLTKIAAFMGVDPSELAELIHIPYRTLKYQISNNCIGTSTLAAIAKVFKDVNIGWHRVNRNNPI